PLPLATTCHAEERRSASVSRVAHQRMYNRSALGRLYQLRIVGWMARNSGICVYAKRFLAHRLHKRLMPPSAVRLPAEFASISAGCGSARYAGYRRPAQDLAHPRIFQRDPITHRVPPVRHLETVVPEEWLGR